MDNSPLLDTMPFVEGSGDRPLESGSYGRFITRGAIGRGGMGIVLRAHDPELDREVALKLLAQSQWRSTGDSIGTQRLQREAQAMAKLQHPNVVTVYEMGRVGDTHFIAMELVEGMTLARWLREHTRTWREIVAAFVQCGRGLAAAHDAGLVHRDFKPDNVLVGNDGRPRVADFGLVGSGVAISDSELGTSDLGHELSVRGAVVGTPAYMAPEQWLGEDVDARADQFAFCVALWEGLFGERPFPGATGAELRGNVLGGVPRAATRTQRVPAKLLAIVRRGLSRDRDARWPAMPELLASLERASRRSAAPWLAAAGVVVAGSAVAAATMIDRREADPCADVSSGLAGIWDATARIRLAAAITASATPDRNQAERIARTLDGYASQWSEHAVAACRAAHASPSALDAPRALCVDRGRIALAAVARARQLTREQVVRLDDAVTRLPDLAVCDDVERSRAIGAQLVDPTTLVRATALDAWLVELDQLRLEGTYAMAGAQAALAEARALGYRPALANALLVVGQLHEGRHDDQRAEATFREAAAAAADAHDDYNAAQAWISVVFNAANRDSIDVTAAAALDPVADAAVRRAGDSPVLRFRYLMASGTLFARKEDFATARSRFEAATKVAPNERERATALRNLVLVVWQADGAGKALPLATETAALTERTLGGDHQDTADALIKVAQIANAAGRAAEAKPAIERAIAIRERVFGRDAQPLWSPYHTLGNIASSLGDVGASRRAFERSIAILEKNGATSEQLATSLGGLGAMLQHNGQPAEAIPFYQRSLAQFEAAKATRTVNYLMLSANLAGTFLALDRCAEAKPIIARIEPALKKLPAYYPELLATIAACARKTSPAAAIAPLSQAIELCGQTACDPLMIAELRFHRATATYEAGRDRPRALAEAREAHAAAIAADPKTPLAPQIEGWLRIHTE